ncbi:MAG: TIGR01212 family radical SAM protein [Clostridiales bacterium]|nr:TIGR01212 family radical SAM protein [Clostridiales bacterium]
MNNLERYNHLNKYLKNKFGERTLKICVDGNFTCPNRDGTLGKGGCIFCSEQGSGEHLKHKLEISEQVTSFLNSYRGERANKFIVYFQNFSNTYAPVETLKQKYDSALIDERIVGISVATRPDCINEEIVKLLATYKEKYYVCVELGLQTSNNITGKLINRVYTSEDFTTSVKLLNEYNIDVVTHIMVGLPNETRKDLENTVAFLNNHDLQGLKIHSTYVVKNTVLEKMYLNGNYTPITLEAYLEDLEYIITHINPNIIIHRISGDAPKESLIAPSWNIHKKLVLNGLDKILREKNLEQGMHYKKGISLS